MPHYGSLDQAPAAVRDAGFVIREPLRGQGANLNRLVRSRYSAHA